MTILHYVLPIFHPYRKTQVDDSIAPSCTLVTGPAGCGKSALLVRWINTLIRYNKVHLIFIPASIRFNMALKNAIFSKLLKIIRY